MAIPYYSSDQLYIDDYLLKSLLDKGFTPAQIRALGSIKSDSGAFNQLLQTGSLSINPAQQAAAGEDPRLARLVANMTTPFLNSKTLYIDDYLFRSLLDGGFDVSSLRVMDVVSASPAFDEYKRTGVIRKPTVPAAASNDPRLTRLTNAVKVPFLQNESIIYLDDFIVKSLIDQGFSDSQIKAIASAPNARVNSNALSAFLKGGKFDKSTLTKGAAATDPRLKRASAALQAKFPGAGPPNTNGVTGVPKTPGVSAPGLTVAQESIRDRINDTLRQYGLGSLTNWALTMIKQGHSDARIIQELRKRPEYIKRFPAMQGRVDGGLQPINEEEYMGLESAYRELMRGKVPEGFYDRNDDFTKFIVDDVSPQELSERITEGYARVAQTDPHVRQAFQEYYGVQGDIALAAMFLDPDRASSELVRQAANAVVGGIGKRLNVNVNAQTAAAISAFSPSDQQVQAGFQQVDQMRAVATESVSETEDLTEQDLVGSAFGLDSTTAENVRRRIRTRMAAFEGGGGSIVTNEGATGLGSA